MSLPDLIFVSLENWDEIWRRNQFVCANLARRHPRMKILFVGLPRNLSNDLRQGRITALRTPATVAVPGLQNVVLTHPWKLLPDSLPLGRRLNEWIARRHIRRVATELGIVDPVLWLNPHSAVHLVGRLPARRVIYDVTDDWISLTQSHSLRELTRAQDAALCRSADAVIVCSGRLLEMKRQLSGNVHLIPNGVDAEHYRLVLDGHGPLPPEAGRWKRPVFGYTGTVHPDRVDLELVAGVAARMPQASLVLLGPQYLSPSDLSRLRALPNVFLPGPVPYSRLPDFMRAFDVCITPHLTTDFTESLNPIKLWEYLAAGKPIVSTDVAGFRDYPALVRIARTPDEFVAALSDALEEGVALADARRNEARRHAWDERVDRIERLVASCGRSGSS